jgi:Ca2+/H+ antiporter
MTPCYAVYGSYLFFQLKSHKYLFDERHTDTSASVKYKRTPQKRDTLRTAGTAFTDLETVPEYDEQEEQEIPQMSALLAGGLLVIVTLVRLFVLHFWKYKTVSNRLSNFVVRGCHC